MIMEKDTMKEKIHHKGEELKEKAVKAKEKLAEDGKQLQEKIVDKAEKVKDKVKTEAKELKEKIDIPCENISGDIKTVAQKLFPSLKSGDIVIGLGAGTITNLGKELLALKEEKIKVVG